MSSPSPLGAAMVTGASSGIGAVYADRLAKRGYDLILVARNEVRLGAIAQRLRNETGRNITTLSADLSAKPDLAKVEALLRDDGNITLLVNNAGLAAVTPLLQSDVDKMDDIIAVNITALTRLAYAAAPAFAARGKGTLINIGSIVGISEILNGVYSASKSYVLTFTKFLQNELADKNVRIQVVLPGATATELWDRVGLPHSNLPPEIVMTAEKMVDAALAGLDQGEVVTIPGLQDAEDWTRFEAARSDIGGKFGNSEPAPRYKAA
jgi:short-subunit dehydrogenase